MQGVGFEQTFTKFIEIFGSARITSLQEKKTSGNYLSGHH